MLTSSSSVTAIKFPASEILTSSKISFSKPSPLIIVTDFRLLARNSDRFLPLLRSQDILINCYVNP